MPRILRLVNTVDGDYGLTNYMQQPVILKKGSKIALQSASAAFTDRGAYQLSTLDSIEIGILEGNSVNLYSGDLSWVVSSSIVNFSAMQTALDIALANPRSDTDKPALEGVVANVELVNNLVSVNVYAEDTGPPNYDTWNAVDPTQSNSHLQWQGMPGYFSVAGGQGEAIRAASPQQFSTVNGLWQFTLNDPLNYGWEGDELAFTIADASKISSTAGYGDYGFCSVIVNGTSQAGDGALASYNIIYDGTSVIPDVADVEADDRITMRIYYDEAVSSRVFYVRIDALQLDGTYLSKYTLTQQLATRCPTISKLVFFAQKGTEDGLAAFSCNTIGAQAISTEVIPNQQNRVFTALMKLSSILAHQLGFSANDFVQQSQGEDHVAFVGTFPPSPLFLRNGIIITIDALGVIGYDGLSRSVNGILGVITAAELEDTVGFTNYSARFPNKIALNNVSDMNVNNFTVRFYTKSLQEQPLRIDQATNVNLLIYEPDEI